MLTELTALTILDLYNYAHYVNCAVETYCVNGSDWADCADWADCTDFADYSTWADCADYAGYTGYADMV